MKNYLFFLFIVSPFMTFAQYPSPTNFEYTLDYIMIGEWGICAEEYIEGPGYCSNFVWNVPDTVGLPTNLEYYDIYVLDYDTNITTIIATLTDTTYQNQMVFVGETWVTAVYSNINGTSEPSNIEINTGIPISIENNRENSKIKIDYDRNFGIVKINNLDFISNIKIFTINGKLIKSINGSVNEICISDFPIGMYIIEVVTENCVIKKKIIK